jgi:hypothetical protein
MSISTRPLYIKTYKPLMTQFIEAIRAVNYDRIPAPFFPVHGKLYEEATTRIAFVGIELKSGPDSRWDNITDFVKRADTDPEGAIFKDFEEFEELAFCDWGDNRETGFWDFVFRILADFHGVPDWRVFKRGESKQILTSFAWGNTNAIERFEKAAKLRGVVEENWIPVKEASECFDQAKHLVNILQPHLMVVTDWTHTPEKWLLDGLPENVARVEIEKHLWYYFLPATQTHVLWTAHPRWLATNPNLDIWSKKLVDIARQRMTF